jgi:hypothetical protein
MCTDTTVHTEQCLKNKAMAEAWEAAHPNACKKCLGYGGFSSYSREDGPDYDFCSACVGQGKCPMCGAAQGDDWEGETCAVCGWNYENVEDGGFTWECYCWEAEAEKEREAAEAANREYWETLTEAEFPLTDEFFAASDFAYDYERDNRYR